MFRGKQTGMNNFMRESAKKAKKKLEKCNLARNYKHMTIVFDSNHFNTIIYTKQCRVLCLLQNKPSLNHFMREKAKKAKKKFKKATQHVISSI